MITKQRLQELIEQGATIYVPDDLWQTVGKIHLEKKCYISEDNKLCNDEITYEDLPCATAMYSIPLEDLFETEEDARWELEMTATRTETLKLPKYEKLPKEFDIPPFIRYNKELENFVLYEMFNSTKNEICVLFRELDDDASDCLFRKPLTKENYIEACKLCLRLFRGEEV